MVMGQSSDAITLTYAFIEDFIYWNEPDKTLMLIREAFYLSLVVAVTIFFIPIRYLIVLGMWGGTL